jgi:hypothetical protein
MKALPLLLVTGTLALGFAAHAQSTISPTLKFAYGANTGWINFRHDQPVSPAGITVSEYTLSGFAYGANFGWLDFGDGLPGDLVRYSNTSATDYGVNHDGTGNLSGFAYGANIGWVNFGWAGANDPNRPRIDLFTGAFTGFAYSANTGWINLGTGQLSTLSIIFIDNDGDAMADAWELENFGNSTTSAGIGTDFDGDGVSDAAEFTAGTDPKDNDSFLRILSHGYNDTFEKVDITFGATGSTRLYRIETTTNLAIPFADVGLGTFAADPGTTTYRAFTVPGTAARFFKVVAVRPLP